MTITTKRLDSVHGKMRISIETINRDLGDQKNMANPQLTKQQREEIFAPLFKKIKEELDVLSAGDPDLLFALRRKLVKDLGYLERGVPMMRVRLKAQKMKEQEGLCAVCGKALPEKGSELDRFEAKLGYTPENTRLVHHDCHIEDQSKKKYS